MDITDKEITDAEATSQTQSLKTLQQEVENLKKEFNRINEECEGTRENINLPVLPSNYHID